MELVDETITQATPEDAPPAPRRAPSPLRGGPLALLRFMRANHMTSPGYAALLARWVLLKLRYGLGYGPTEVAEQMGYRTSSIRKVTNRCLAALTRQLLAVGFDREPAAEPQDG